MALVVFLVLALFTVSGALDVGKCKKVTAIPVNDFLEKVAAEANGEWKYTLIPKSDANKKFTSMTLKITSAAPEEGYYWKTTYHIEGQEHTLEYSELVYKDADGQLTSLANNGEKQEKHKMYLLEYVSGDMFMIYKCDKNGGDNVADVMYTLGHKKFTDSQKTEVENFSDGCGLSGDLRLI